MGAVAQLIEIETERGDGLIRCRAASSEGEPAREGAHGRVRAEPGEIHPVDLAIPHFVGQGVAQVGDRVGRDGPAADEQLGMEIEPPPRERE